jgi:hypothetical protein
MLPDDAPVSYRIVVAQTLPPQSLALPLIALAEGARPLGII